MFSDSFLKYLNAEDFEIFKNTNSAFAVYLENRNAKSIIQIGAFGNGDCGIKIQSHPDNPLRFIEIERFKTFEELLVYFNQSVKTEKDKEPERQESGLSTPTEK